MEKLATELTLRSILDAIRNNNNSTSVNSTSGIPMGKIATEDTLLELLAVVSSDGLGDSGESSKSYLNFTGGEDGSDVTVELQAMCTLANSLGIPVRLPGWDLHFSSTLFANQLIGTRGKTRLIPSQTFTATGFANEFLILNSNFSQGFDEATANYVVYRDFDVEITPSDSTRGKSLIGLGGVKGGVISGLRLTAKRVIGTDGEPIRFFQLIDVYCTTRNLHIYGNEFRQLTGAWGAGTPIQPDGGGCLNIRNLRGGLASDAENYTTQDIFIHHNYFEHLTSDECFAVYGVRGITRRIKVHHNVFIGLPTTADKVYNKTFIAFFPLNDGSGVNLGATSAVYDCEFSNNYVESASTLYELFRIGNSPDANNKCYNNRSFNNYFFHRISFDPVTGAVAAATEFGAPVSPVIASCGARCIDGNFGVAYIGDASGNTSSSDMIVHLQDAFGSSIGTAWSGFQSVSNPTCYGGIITAMSFCRNVNGGQVECFARAFYNCRSVVGTSWRVNGRNAIYVGYDVDSGDGSQYSMANTNGFSQGGFARINNTMNEASRVNFYNNTATIYSNTLEPPPSRVAVEYSSLNTTVTLRLNEISGSFSSVNSGLPQRVKLWVQTTAPTAENPKDLWIDTSGTPILKRWVDPAWITATDRTGAAIVLSLGATEAGGDNILNVFVQETPSGATPAEGDVQSKPSEGYKLYRFTSGSWVDHPNTAFATGLLTVSGVGRLRRSLNNWGGVED